jgi:hypothetical protein
VTWVKAYSKLRNKTVIHNRLNSFSIVDKVFKGSLTIARDLKHNFTMPLLPREGLTIEAVYGLFQRTLFDPLFIGIWLAAVLYFPQQVHYFLPTAIWHYVSTKSFLLALKGLFAYGAVRHFNNSVSRMVLNNWTRDPWKDGKEIVIVTGGSGGIGEATVRAISKSSAHVIAVDLVRRRFTQDSN